MSDLRPNPFCGHDVMRDVVADDQHRDICCAVDCDLDMLFRMSDADWNTRPIEDALRAEVERLRKRLGYITDISEANADRAIVEMKRIAHEALDSAPAEEEGRDE